MQAPGKRKGQAYRRIMMHEERMNSFWRETRKLTCIIALLVCLPGNASDVVAATAAKAANARCHHIPLPARRSCGSTAALTHVNLTRSG